MVLAVGTQFTHLDRKSTPHPEHSRQSTLDEDTPPGDATGVVYYQEACKLIPDILVSASVESAQAFLILAAYTLPLDAQGLAYTYLGLAVKMCVQNGMHRKHSGGNIAPTSAELQRRLWWTAYSLDK